MKIAVISDIHGNMTALEAVMNDIHRRNVDKIICLGDIIGKGPDSKETVDICRRECDIILRGNWEDVLYKSYLAAKRGEASDEADLWYINDTGAERMEYLGTLPHCAELYLSGKLVRFFHAHPLNFNRYFAESPMEQRLELFESGKNMAENRPSDVAIYGDIHSAYYQILQGKHLVNAGSVGNPMDINQASYVILEGGDSSESGFDVGFVRIPYDTQKTVSIAKARNVPFLDGYITEILKAKYYKRG